MKNILLINRLNELLTQKLILLLWAVFAELNMHCSYFRTHTSRNKEKRINIFCFV